MRTRAFRRGTWLAIGGVFLLWIAVSRPEAQTVTTGIVTFPKKATALEGLPQIRIDSTRDSATRRTLDPVEAARDRLTIRIADGRLYWSSRGDRPLAQTSFGDFTYLSSAEPGRYVRIRWLNDKLTYVEHVDTEFGSVTYWGELRVVIGK